MIDDTWTQAHSLALADINGDGTPDLVAGKRFMAHNGRRPGRIRQAGCLLVRAETRGQSTVDQTRHFIR